MFAIFLMSNQDCVEFIISDYRGAATWLVKRHTAYKTALLFHNIVEFLSSNILQMSEFSDLSTWWCEEKGHI